MNTRFKKLKTSTAHKAKAKTKIGEYMGRGKSRRTWSSVPAYIMSINSQYNP